MEETIINFAKESVLAGIFAWACVRLFNSLIALYGQFILFLTEQITISRQQAVVLMEQNKMLSIALFGNNPDAQRAYHAMVQSEKSSSVSSVITKVE